jgi:hypothetical protein
VEQLKYGYDVTNVGDNLCAGIIFGAPRRLVLPDAIRAGSGGRARSCARDEANMTARNGRPSRNQIARALKGLTVPASRSKTFRKMAADALRAGRKAPAGEDRDAHFEVAASYKSLAHDDEWLCGERQRSYKRKPRAQKPKPDR